MGAKKPGKSGRSKQTAACQSESRPSGRQVANGVPINDKCCEDLAVFRPQPCAVRPADAVRAVLHILVKAGIPLDMDFLSHHRPSEYLRRIRVKGQLHPHSAYHPHSCYTAQGDLLQLLERDAADCALYCSVNARIENLVAGAEGAGCSFSILSIPLRELCTPSGLPFLAPAADVPISVTHSFEFRTRRTFKGIARRLPLAPPPENWPREFQEHCYCGFLALNKAELPQLARDVEGMALAYEEAQSSFLGAGHPDWRRRGDAAITWFYPLTPSMMAVAQRAAITEHQLEDIRRWMTRTLAAGHLDKHRLADFGLELMDMGDNPAAKGNDVFGHLLPQNFAAAHPSGPHPRGSPTAAPPVPQAGPLHTAAQELAAESEKWGQDVDMGSAACCDSSTVQRWHDQGKQAVCGQQGWGLQTELEGLKYGDSRSLPGEGDFSINLKALWQPQ